VVNVNPSPLITPPFEPPTPYPISSYLPYDDDTVIGNVVVDDRACRVSCPGPTSTASIAWCYNMNCKPSSLRFRDCLQGKLGKHWADTTNPLDWHWRWTDSGLADFMSVIDRLILGPVQLCVP
jgi:hypothetical protein